MILDGVPDSSMFSGLCDVESTAVALTPLLAFMRTRDNPALDSFEVDSNGDVAQVEEFYDLFATHCQHAQLTYLVFLISVDSPHPGRPCIACSIFHLLQILNIACSNSDLDDTTAAAMARAWPRIEVLRLRSGDPDHEPQCTFLALVSFARDCDRIRELHLAFDASSVPQRMEGVSRPSLDIGEPAEFPVDAAESVVRIS